LRRYARNRNLRLTDVAEAGIVGSLDPQAWARRAVRPLRCHRPSNGDVHEVLARLRR